MTAAPRRVVPPSGRGAEDVARISPSFRTFAVIWLGQLVSVTGSGLTGFALGVWVYQTTGSVTRFAAISVCTVLPAIVLSPLAGALVDRWDRRWAMIAADTGAGACTLTLALLIWSGRLEVWHIYVLMGLISTCDAVQWPAFTASPSLLVPKRHLGRAAGMIQVGRAASQLVAPVVAGYLVTAIGVQAAILADFCTFAFAVTTLLVVRIPRPRQTAEGRASRSSLLREALSGWTYIAARRGLLALLILFAAINFTNGTVQILITPLVLSFAPANTLGVVLSIAGGGMLAGGLVISAWGGPERRVLGILAALPAYGLLLAAGTLRPSAPLIAVAGFGVLFLASIITGCSQAIWQSKVAVDLQGRVFAVRGMVAWSTLPLAYATAGPLADHLFEPLLAAAGPLAGTVGRVIGVGPGRGMAFYLLLLGLGLGTAGLLGLRYRPLREVEDDLPDAVTDGSEAGGEAAVRTGAAPA